MSARMHTAGPWSWYEHRKDDPENGPVKIETRTRVVAEVISCGIGCHAERVANARLMSKAPELLGLLEEAVSELVQWHEQYHPECTGGCPTVNIVLRAREIVRQATGEE